MKIVMLGIDLDKNVCSLAGLDETGAVILRRRMKRGSVLLFTAQLERCTVAMEACCGAHHLGRQLIAQGHAVRLMSPAYVQPLRRPRRTTNAMRKRLRKQRHDRPCGMWRSRVRPSSKFSHCIASAGAWLRSGQRSSISYVRFCWSAASSWTAASAAH
jgi:transposase